MAISLRRSGIRSIKVPLALLLSTELTPATKLLWIRMRFDEMHPRRRSHSPRQLAKRTCLARSTVYEALRQAVDTGWLVQRTDRVSRKRRWKTACPVPVNRGVVTIPVDLIRSAHALRPQSILCYGLLQATPEFRARVGTFKWAELRALTGLHLRTLKRAVRALAEARWIVIVQAHRRAPIWFRLQHADQAYKEEIKKDLEQASYVGEALMRSMLSFIVDTRECEDGARPEFLVNPISGERLELDRYYPVHRVAFEFNGKQHYVAGGRFTKQDVAAQRKRDRIKHQICKEKKVQLVVIHAEDLSLCGMLKKARASLPLRTLRGFKETIRYLNYVGMRYRISAASG